MTTVQAVDAVGVSVPVGSRWFLRAGGMPPITMAERMVPSVVRRTLLCVQHSGVREIARRIGRDPRTISRELR